VRCIFNARAGRKQVRTRGDCSLAPGVALAPRAPGSTHETKTAEAPRLATSARSRSPLRRATTTTTTTDLMHPRKKDDGPSTQWTDHHDPDQRTKKVGRIRPRPSWAPGRTHEIKIGSTTARDISKVALSTASSDDHHHRKKKRRRRRGRWPPRLARPRHPSGTREHARTKEGDKSADRGLRLNRSRQQGRSTAYTTLIQLRGLRRI